MTFCRVILLLLTLATITASAQDPAFDVASVRPSGDPGGGINLSIPGEVTLEGVFLRFVISIAFDVELPLTDLKFDHSKVSKGLLDTPFSIRAKGNPDSDSRAMLRTLLKERFGLRHHTESREAPVYALVVKESGKLGPWLKPTLLNCGEQLRQRLKEKTPLARPCSALPRERRFGVLVRRFAGTLDEFVARVAQQHLLDRLVLNESGLEGNYEWEVAFGLNSVPIRDGAPTFIQALEDQLGLKIESRTGRHEIIVIDSVQMPTPN